MTFGARLGSAWSALLGRASVRTESWGTTGGPGFSDAWRIRRGPTPQRLVEAYKQVVYACANLNAAGTARLPLRLYATTAGGQQRPRGFSQPVEVNRTGQLKRLRQLPYLVRQMSAAERVDEVTAHPILDLLDDPNPEFDRHTLIAYLVLSLDVVGTAYLRPRGGAKLSAGSLPPEDLWPLQAHLVKPVAGDSAIPLKYSYTGETILAEDLLRFRHLSLKEPYGSGYSPAEAAFGYAGLESMWVSIQEQILGRGPAPSAMVGPRDANMPFSEPTKKRLEASFAQKQIGAAAGQLLVCDEAYTYTPLTYRPTDLSGLEIGKYDLERTANCFNVPLPFLTGETNLANLQAAETQHGRHAIEPRSQLIATRLTRWVRQYDPRLFFAFDPAVSEDEEREAKVWDLRIKNGSATINEARLEDGCSPVAWGDEPWLPQTLRQPSEERPAPPAIKPPGEDKPKVEPEDEEDDTEEEDVTEKALLADVAAILKVVKGRLADEQGEAGGAGDHHLRPRTTDPRLASAGARQHLRTSRWAADTQDPEAVVQDPGEGHPGPDPVDRGAAADALRNAGGLQRSDGIGDDADPVDLLAGERGEDAGAAGT